MWQILFCWLVMMVGLVYINIALFKKIKNQAELLHTYEQERHYAYIESVSYYHAEGLSALGRFRAKILWQEHLNEPLVEIPWPDKVFLANHKNYFAIELENVSNGQRYILCIDFNHDYSQEFQKIADGGFCFLVDINEEPLSDIRPGFVSSYLLPLIEEETDNNPIIHPKKSIIYA